MADALQPYDDEAAAPAQAAPSSAHFEETADYEKGFSEYFDREIKPLLDTLEAQRIDAIAEMGRRKRYGVPLVLAVVLFGFWLMVRAGEPRILYLIIFGTLAIFGWMGAPGKEFQRDESTALLPRAARFFGDFNWSATGGVDTATIRGTGIVSVAPGTSPEVRVTDALDGMRGGRRMVAARVYTGEGSGKSHRTLFDGDLIMSETRKPFAGITVVTAGGSNSFSGLQDVQLEDPTFMKRFAVRSSDQIDARVLLTPDVMERMTQMASLPDMSFLTFSFVQNTLCISFWTHKPLFELPGAERSMYDTSDFHSFLARMHNILSIVDLIDARS